MSTSAPTIKNAYPPTPELNKLQAVKDKSQTIGEFLDWLQTEQHIELCVRHEHSDGCYVDDQEDGCPLLRQSVTRKTRTKTCGCHEGEYVPTHGSIEKRLADYFEINMTKVENERRAILDFLRKQNE